MKGWGVLFAFFVTVLIGTDQVLATRRSHITKNKFISYFRLIHPEKCLPGYQEDKESELLKPAEKCEKLEVTKLDCFVSCFLLESILDQSVGGSEGEGSQNRTRRQISGTNKIDIEATTSGPQGRATMANGTKDDDDDDDTDDKGTGFGDEKLGGAFHTDSESAETEDEEIQGRGFKVKIKVHKKAKEIVKEKVKAKIKVPGGSGNYKVTVRKRKGKGKKKGGKLGIDSKDKIKKGDAGDKDEKDKKDGTSQAALGRNKEDKGQDNKDLKDDEDLNDDDDESDESGSESNEIEVDDDDDDDYNNGTTATNNPLSVISKPVRSKLNRKNLNAMLATMFAGEEGKKSALTVKTEFIKCARLFPEPIPFDYFGNCQPVQDILDCFVDVLMSCQH